MVWVEWPVAANDQAGLVSHLRGVRVFRARCMHISSQLALDQQGNMYIAAGGKEVHDELSLITQG